MKKTVLDNSEAIEIRGLKALGAFESHESKTHVEDEIELEVCPSLRNPYLNVLYGGMYSTIYLEALKTHFGGHNWYFQCPMERQGQMCFKRTTKLYFKDGLFGCRECQNLTYASQVQARMKRPTDYLERIDYLKEQIESLPRKYYRNRPTKKHERLRQKLSTLANRPQVAYELALRGDTGYVHSYTILSHD